nr:hypothetical protein CFP56_06892 [Quercus suber]
MVHSMSLVSTGLIKFGSSPQTRVSCGKYGTFSLRYSPRLLRIRAVQENGGPRRLVDIIRVVPELSRNYFRSPSRRALFGGISLLGGFYVAQTISLSFGALGVNDVIAAVVCVLLTEYATKFYYSRPKESLCVCMCVIKSLAKLIIVISDTIYRLFNCLSGIVRTKMRFIAFAELVVSRFSVNGIDQQGKKRKENDGKAEKDSGLSNAEKNNNARAKPRKGPVSCKVNEHCTNLEVHIFTINLENKEFDADIPLPQGTSLITIADIEGLNYLLKMLDIFSNF